MSDEHSVDFLRKNYDFAPTPRKTQRTRAWQRVFLVFISVSAICGIVFSYSLAKKHKSSSTEFESFSLLNSLRTLVGAEDKILIGEEDDRINFLFLGIGGSGHAGPELTDSIIFASFKPSTGEVGFLSIPRDLAVPIPGYGYQKINSINAYGEMEKKGSGAEMASEIIGNLLKQKIHYFVKADFDGFIELIDEIGDVDIYVDTSFTDTSYPTDDDFTTIISFSQGWQTMDGATALMFTRSRHGSNGEGSDFSRAKRQQKVLLAVKEKLLSASTFLNPSKLNRLISVFENNVETNLSFWEIMKLARSATDIDVEAISMQVLNETANGPLYSTHINGAYVLLPKRDDWTAIEKIADNLLNPEAETISMQEQMTPALSATVEIQNGTSVSGLAFQASQLLSASSFTVVSIGNADSKTYERTIIYDLTDGEKTSELSALKNFLQADIAMSPSGWIFSDNIVPRELTLETPDTDAQENVDFLIILGENATNLVFR